MTLSTNNNFSSLAPALHGVIFFDHLNLEVNPKLISHAFREVKDNYDQRNSRKVIEYFRDIEKRSSIVAWAWDKAVEELKEEDAPSIKIAGTAFKVLLGNLDKKRKETILSKYGRYSLDIKKVKETEQQIFDKALTSIWGKVQEKFRVLGIQNVPNGDLEEIREWLKKPENQGQINQVDFLDLSCLSLTVLPPEIKAFSNLTNLNLSYNKLKDISALTSLRNLSEIDLNHNQLQDVSPLGSLLMLNKLNLSNNSITTLNGLETLLSLSKLYLVRNKLENLNPISGLNMLTLLDASFNNIKNIEALRNLPLKKLNLANNQIEEIGPLENVISLRSLTLRSNPIRNADPLSNLVELRRLDLRSTLIEGRE